jgi:L-2-hydroxyglutarate oxidase LhgO
MISGQLVRVLEPNVTAESALLVPSAGIVEPTSLVYRLHTLAHQAGVHFMVGTEVLGLRGNGDFIDLAVRYPGGATDQIKAKAVINAGGVDADGMAKRLNPSSPYKLDPVRGESYKFYQHKRPELKITRRNIYPTPESVITPHGCHFTVGIHLTPTFEDLCYPPSLGSTITVGPKVVPVENRNDSSGNWSASKIFAEKVKTFFPSLKQEDLMWHQAGIQARLKDHPDFVIEPDPQYPQFLNLLGIDSPGLTACLAIARKVRRLVDDFGF